MLPSASRVEAVQALRALAAKKNDAGGELARMRVAPLRALPLSERHPEGAMARTRLAPLNSAVSGRGRPRAAHHCVSEKTSDL